MKDFSSVTICHYETEEPGSCRINPVLQTTLSPCGQWWIQFGGRSGNLKSCFAPMEKLARWCWVVAWFILGWGLSAAHWSTYLVVCMIYFLPCFVLYYTRCAVVPLKMVALSQPASCSLDLPTVYMTVIGVLGEIPCFGEHSLCLGQVLGPSTRLTLVGVLSLYLHLWVWAVSRGFFLSFGDSFSYLDYVFVFRENIFLLLITLSWQHSFGPFTSVCRTFFCSGISGEFLIIYCLVYTFTFYVTSHFPNEPYLGHNILINRIILLQCVTLFQAEISQTPFILCEVTNTSGIPFISNGGVHFTPLDGDGAGYHGTATS